jgi:predicted Ser/Thr protein kinase
MALNLKTETVFTDDTAAAQAPLPPDQIAPHFPQLEILECLGRGGMGVVYKARQKTLNRLVALKLLAPERVGDAKFAERFTREAQALAALNHPNIVTIHDFGQAGGFYFLLMEFVDGLNLRQLLRMRKFTPEEALAIVPSLCDALQFAHDRGIVHRDIKPENILLDKTGRVKVADFGIAKMLGAGNGGASSSEAAAPTSATQSTLGTPGYSAPEQKTDPQRVDSRADIYSLGVVFYELLTGELPGKPIEAPSKKVRIDVRLDEVVLRALEQKPELRYQQASVLKTEVETIMTTPPAAGSRGSAAAAPPSDEAKAPAPPTADDLEEVRRQVTAPAIGLIVSSVLYGLFLIAVLFTWTILTRLTQEAALRIAGNEANAAIPRLTTIWAHGAGLSIAGQAAPIPWIYVIPVIVLALIGFDIVAFAGALRMRRLRSHQLAVAGSVSAMLGFGLTLPFGIWAFVVLNRREVREAFGKSDREPPVNAPPMAAKSGRLRAALIVGVLAWLFVTGTVTLITWNRPESWKVVAVMSWPQHSDALPMEEQANIATMIALIQSDVILGRVIDRLELDERSGNLDKRWGKRNLGLKLTKAQALFLLKQRLDVRSEGGTLILSVYGKRPETDYEALDIAAAITQEIRAYRREQHYSPADDIVTTVRATPPDILRVIAAGSGFVLGLLAGGLVLWRGFLRRGPQAASSRGSAGATPPSDEAKAPAPPTADDLEEVRRQVTAPAIALIVSSVLYGLFLIAALFIWTCGAALSIAAQAEPIIWIYVIPVILVLMGFDIVAFAGALRMRRLRSHQLALAGSVSAMLGFGLTLPFGIWAFVVLNRREVREAFGKGDREPPVKAPPRTLAPPSECAMGNGKPWVSYCVALAYAGTVLFGLLAEFFPGHVLNQWLVGIFLVLSCLTPLLALLLNRLATPQSLRTWFKLAAWLGAVTWLPVIGIATYYLYAISTLDESPWWAASLDDIILLALIWLGAVALPICVVRLWRAVKKPVTGSGASVPPVKAPPTAAKSGLPRWGKWALGCCVAGLLLLVGLTVTLYLLQGGAPQAVAAAPAIESVVVGRDRAHWERALIKAHGSVIPGLDVRVGTNSDFWLDHHIHDPFLINCTTYPGNKFSWSIKSVFHDIHYREGDDGDVTGEIVLREGTLTPEPDGSYVIGEFRPEKGVPLPPLPIVVRLAPADESPQAGKAPAAQVSARTKSESQTNSGPAITRWTVFGPGLLSVGIVVGIMVGLGFLIARAVWRAAKKPGTSGAAAAVTPQSALPPLPPTGQAPVQHKGLAIASLVLGLLSPLFCLLTGVPAIVCGHIARARARRAPAQYGGGGLALAGLILGYVALILTLIIVTMYFLLGTEVPAKTTSQSTNSESQANSGPAITRLTVSAGKAVIEGQGSTNAVLDIRIGKPGWGLAVIITDSHFTATIKPAWLGEGLEIVAKGSRGDEICNTRDRPTKPRGRFVLRDGTPTREADGSYVIGEFRPETGAPLPITVRLEKPEESKPGSLLAIYSAAAQNPSFGPVIERQVNKPVSDFPETTDVSTPESACAAWQRASARKDAQAVSRLSWVKIDPAEWEAWFRDEETRDREGLAIYLKALTESRIVEVQTWRDDLADVITFLPFPPGKGRHPYSARSFGRIGGQWKNLSEDCLPSLEAAHVNFAQKKEVIWEQLQSLQAGPATER